MTRGPWKNKSDKTNTLELYTVNYSWKSITQFEIVIFLKGQPNPIILICGSLGLNTKTCTIPKSINVHLIVVVQD